MSQAVDEEGWIKCNCGIYIQVQEYNKDFVHCAFCKADWKAEDDGRNIWECVTPSKNKNGKFLEDLVTTSAKTDVESGSETKMD